MCFLKVRSAKKFLIIPLQGTFVMVFCVTFHSPTLLEVSCWMPLCLSLARACAVKPVLTGQGQYCKSSTELQKDKDNKPVTGFNWFT
jgi:hypothetical protein